MGNYGIILSLLGCLERGLQAKRLVDRVIDASLLTICPRFPFLTFLAADRVTNLREDILIHRINSSLTSMEEDKGETLLGRAVKALEK